MQVHHHSEDGTVAIVSFFLSISKNAKENAFLKSIESDIWVKKNA